MTKHYLWHYGKEIAHTRELTKKYARRTTVGIAALNGIIAMLGVTIAIWPARATWLGLASTGVAGVIGVITAWSGLFRHQDLWQQRSLILAELQRITRNAERREPAGEDRQVIAREAMEQLDSALGQDASSWGSLTRTQPAGGQGRPPAATGEGTQE
ncbi:SLATT domain-containing protein [Streptomyces sp. NPDC006333]|uniref:SLATT domain-containing protein n=1 Tax=Streptomyces sp. NPDC006333 TaxID=3156753 RepID=UPI0033AE34C0